MRRWAMRALPEFLEYLLAAGDECRRIEKAGLIQCRHQAC
jgi:hypothetical protein